MKRLVAGLAFVIMALAFGLCIYLWWQRRNLPYNEEGRYFDGLVIYEEQSASAYLMLVLIFILTSLLSGYWVWRRPTASKEKSTSIDDFEQG